MNRRLPVSAFAFLVLSVGLRASAATTQLQILIDSDNNDTTGCAVATPAGTFAGVEQIVTTSFDDAVSGVTRQRCVDPAASTFSPAEAFGPSGWKVGSGSGTLLVETHLGTPPSGPMRFGFVINSGTLVDAILNEPDGSAIIFPQPYTGPPRRRAVVLDSGRQITLDGNGADWDGLQPIVQYAAGIGTAALQFLNVWAFGSPNDTYLRFDVQDNPNAPKANPDSYTTLRSATLTVAAPGVLANDRDPNGKPLHATLVTGPQHGTLTLNADGGFTYTNDGSQAPTDRFEYQASNGTDASNTAVSAFIVIDGTPPLITSANHTTFTVGARTTFKVTATGVPQPTVGQSAPLPSGVTFDASTGILTGTPAADTGGNHTLQFTAMNAVGTSTQLFTLAIDEAPTFTSAATLALQAGSAATFSVTTFGFPAPSMTESGALPAGVTFVDNHNGTATIGGTPANGSGGTYPITLTATNTAGTASQSLSIVVCNVVTVTDPATVSATANSPFSQTFTQSGGVGAVTFALDSGVLPAGLTLSSSGTLSGTPAQTGTFPITVRVTDSLGCIGIGAAYNLVVSCQSIAVTDPALATGSVNAPFSQTFTAANTIGTVSFSTASALPAGLALSPSGVLSGTPLQSGAFPIVVDATDGNGCMGTGAAYNLIIACQAIAVADPAGASGTVNVPFSQTFTATNTIGAVTFSTASALPAGLTLAADGTLAGTPTQTGTFPIVVVATDANGCTGTGATYNLVIACQTIGVANPANAAGMVTVPFSETFTASNTIGAVAFTTASPLPTGITLSSVGVLSGTPLQPGAFPIVVTATDANGCTGTSATYNLTIACQPIVVTNPSTTSSPAGTPLSINFTQTGAVGAATFATTSTLPTGLTLAADGTLSGTPTQGGSFPIAVTATDSNGCTGANAAYTLTITCPTITVTNPATTTATVGAAFSQTFTETGGNGTVTFTTASALPSGLTLANNGTLSGTPAQFGSFPIVVTATDQNGCTGTGSTYTLTIGCPTITVTNPGVTTGTVDSPFSQTFTQSGAFGTPAFTTTSTLPAGLTLASDGTLSGTPSVNGVFPIVVTVTDSAGCTGTGATYTLTINCPTITVTNPLVNGGTVDAPFSQMFTETGAHATATFTTASTLPPGLVLASNGLLAGTPAAPGSFPITVTVTDSNGCTGTSSTYALGIGCQGITVTNPANATGTVNAPFSEQFIQTGGHGTTTFSTSSTLPSGFSLDANSGVLSGTTQQHITFPIVVVATDANSCTGSSATYNLIINCQSITVSNPLNNTGTVAVPFSEQFTQTGAVGGATFSTASALPTGLTLDGATGLLSGTPLQAGTFPIDVTVTDGNGCTATNTTYTLIIACNVITVTNPAVNSGTAGTAFNQTFTQSGGNGTITWSETGTLPAGITLGSATGALVGTTTQTGSFPIIVTATDVNGCTGTSNYTLTINCQTINVTNPVVNAGTAGVAFDQTFTATAILGTATWNETGTLPIGITMNSATGHLAGTTTETGSFPITVRATDTNGCFATSSYTLTIVCQTITVTNPATSIGTAGVAFNQTFTATGILGTVTWSESGALPAGLSFNTSTGHLSGTPTQTGSFPITVTATDTNGCSGTGATYNLSIVCPTITVARNGGGSFPAATISSSYMGQSVTGSGSNGTPLSFALTGGTFPTGLTLAANGGISGTPTATGTFTFTVTATDAYGCTGSQSFTIAVNPVATGDSYGTLVDNTQAAVTGGTTSSPATPFVALTGTIIGNDLPSGGVTLTTGTFGTTAGGSVTTAADGTFLYTPKANPAGAVTTSDSFTYQISSNTGGTPTPTTATGTVTLTLANRVWYVKNNGSAGNGQSQSPFNTLSAAITASTTNDTIFVYHGDGTTTNLATASTLKTGQSLIGEGAGLTVNTHALVAAGGFPLIGNTITLAGSVTINGIDMTTGASTGISGGSVSGDTVTVRNLTSTTGTAVSLNGTGGTFTFTSVSANGGATGISLINTTGSFTVTGDGSTANSGGTIQNEKGSDQSTAGTGAQGIGLYMSTAQNVSLSWMHFHDFDNFGIQGTSVTNFSMDHCTVDGANGNNTQINPNSSLQNQGEGSVQFYDLLGTCSLTNSTFSGGIFDTIQLTESTGTLSSLTINNCTISETNTTNGGSAVEIFGPGSTSASVALTFTNNTITQAHSSVLSFILNSTGSMSATVTGNTFRNADPNPAGHGVFLTYAGSHSSGTAFSFDVENNIFGGSNSNSFNFTALAVGKAVPTTPAIVTASGKIINNTFGTSGVQGSSTRIGSNSDALEIDCDGQGPMTVLVKNNSVHGYDENGMSFFDEEGSAALNATVIGNTIDTPNTNDSIAGIDLTVAAAPTDTNLACLHIGSVLGGETSADKNSISGAPGTVAIGQANDILFNGQASAAGQIDLPGYTGSTTDTTAVTNYLKAANTLADSPFVTFNQAVNNFHNSPGGADCAQPPLLFAAGGVERAAMPAFDTEVPLTRSAFRPNSMVGTDGLSRQQLDFIVEAARQRWIATGLTKDQIAKLNRLRFLIDDLGGSYLGISDCDHVTLDRTAAGHGWFIDPTPSRDDEFGNHASNGRLYTDPYSAPAGHVDLLTAVMHEMGHDLGMPDLHESAQRDDIMYAELTVGERRLPRREDLRLVRTRSAADPDIRADAAPAAALTIHSSTTAPVANPIVGTPVTTPGTGSSHCPVFANGADGGG